MKRFDIGYYAEADSLPHVRGDEPYRHERPNFHGNVCPTCVGMNRKKNGKEKPAAGLPHVCGDEPFGINEGSFYTIVCPT